MIPDNITRQDIVQAIQEIKRVGVPDNRESTQYNFVYESETFPPKLVISVANKYANGEELDPSLFSGGEETNNYLERLGFEIIAKDDAKRNPPWQRDELILALDLYFRYPPHSISKTHPEVIKLSEILNNLPIHSNRPNKDKFRNPNGVYMKMCNFLRLDPTYKGKGLTSGGKLEEDIWLEFANDKIRLAKLAKLIINSTSIVYEENNLQESLEQEEDFPEGKILYRLHRVRERNKELVKKAKEKRRKEAGGFNCDICGFNFFKTYGDIGADYIECHHTKPLSELENGEKTNVKDLALVCANCHRMLHRKRPWLSIEQLKQLIK
jgi:5-methylcytosine-specific restriction protein A